MSINTILFDLDGTLINTNELIIESFLHTLNHYYPGRFKREDVLPFIGPPLAETFQAIDPDRADEMINRYRQFNHQYHNELVKEFATVCETLETLRKHHFKLGIVTTKIRETVEMGLKLTNLKSFFGAVVTLDDVEHAKPHPEPIFLALKQLGAKPSEAIMVGDNLHDIEAGKNAGTYTAGVSWSIKGKEYIESLKPDYVLEQMSDLLNIVME